MKLTVEVSLWDFEAWEGGRDTLVQLQNNLTSDEMEALENQIEEILCAGYSEISDTTLNDFLWFECDTIAEQLGYSSWEEFEKAKKEEQDD